MVVYTAWSVLFCSYVKLKEKMKLLWDAEMRLNTVNELFSFRIVLICFRLTLAIARQVHVYDVCQALWHLSTAGKPGHVYNLVDKNDTSASLAICRCTKIVNFTDHCCWYCGTDQEKINTILEEIFRIKTGFIGKLISNLARVSGHRIEYT